MKYNSTQYFLTLLFLSLSVSVSAQQKGVAINKPSLDEGLILDVSGLDGNNRFGVRLSPLSLAPQIPVEGSIYYDTQLATYRQYNGMQWQSLFTPPPAPSFWTFNGTNTLNSIIYNGNVGVFGDFFLGEDNKLIGIDGLAFFPTVSSANAGTNGFTIDPAGLFAGNKAKIGENNQENADAEFNLEVWGNAWFHNGTGTTLDYAYFDNIAIQSAADEFYVLLQALPGNPTTLNAALTVTPSDARLKHAVMPIKSALSRLQKLNGVTYGWNTTAKELFTRDQGNNYVLAPGQCQEELNEHIAIERAAAKDKYAARETGLIAQDLQKVLPEAVVEAEDGYLRVKYGHLAGLFVEAIKEQQTIIDAQADRIRELERQQLSVLARLEKLETASIKKTRQAKD